jgi:hypothetical protein
MIRICILSSAPTFSVLVVGSRKQVSKTNEYIHCLCHFLNDSQSGKTPLLTNRLETCVLTGYTPTQTEILFSVCCVRVSASAIVISLN